MLQIKIDEQALRNAQSALARIPGAIQKANEKATKRALESLRTTAARAIPQEYNVKQADVRKAIRLTHNAGLSGEMLVRGSRIPLSKFKMSPKRPPVKHGIMASVRRNSGMKAIPRAFLLALKSGFYPFIRTGSARSAIKMLVSLAVPQMLELNDELKAQLIEKGSETYEKNLSFWVSKFIRGK